jgi:HEAT repeat protein
MLEQAQAAVIRFRAVAGEPGHADLYEGWLWSVWLSAALDQDDAGLPPPAAIPAAAQPHLRFAAAWQAAQAAEPATSFDLDRLTLAAQGALDDFTMLTSKPGPMRPATITQTRHSWNGTRPGEGAMAAAWCMGSTRRATHEDPDLDLRVAVLEALARLQQPPPADAFLALVGSEEPEIVRWTAARIGAALDPQAASALDVSSETAPLVLGRTAPGKGPSGP